MSVSGKHTTTKADALALAKSISKRIDDAYTDGFTAGALAEHAHFCAWCKHHGTPCERAQRLALLPTHVQEEASSHASNSSNR